MNTAVLYWGVFCVWIATRIYLSWKPPANDLALWEFRTWGLGDTFMKLILFALLGYAVFSPK